MKPKTNNINDPKNYRPITCLPTVYKIFTSIFASKIYKHLINNNLLATEQNGCRKGSQGCRELLVIDSVVTRQVRKRQRNLSIAWIDYKKAFDSVPHSWIIQVLRLHKIDSGLLDLLEICMDNWTTKQCK